MQQWSDISPAEAKAQGLDLSKCTDITAPHNEEGERCPWPWEPQQLVGAPMGQYHCPYCGAMVMAGMEHLDYGTIEEQEAAWEKYQREHEAKVEAELDPDSPF